MTRSRCLCMGAAVLAAGTIAGAPAHAQTPPGTAAQAMQGHFDAALEVHAAIISGDLAAAGLRAEQLVHAMEQERPGPGSAEAHAAVVDAGRAVIRATSVLGAAMATADMLNGCGRCHRAAGVTPAFPPMARTRVDTMTGLMHAHRQAADHLLEGLVVPSDEAWQSGARALATAPLYDPTLRVAPAVQQSLAAMEARFHRLATDAEQTTDPRARAAFYAQFLAGCADCHRRHRAVP